MTKKQWGLLDMDDRVWLGDDTGPMLFTDEAVAQVAAIVQATQLEWPRGRVKAHPFTEAKPLQVRDEIETTTKGRRRARAMLRELP